MPRPAKQPMTSGEIGTLASNWLEFAVTYLNTASTSRVGIRQALLNEMKDIEKKFIADDKIYQTKPTFLAIG